LADYSVIFSDTLDILTGGLSDSLWVSWVKTKIQASNDIQDAAILSVPAYGVDVEIAERFTYLRSDVHVSACCELEVDRHHGQALGVMDSLDHGVWHSQYLCRWMKFHVFQSMVYPVLLYKSETKI